MRVKKADGTFVEIGAPGDQIYTWDAPDKTQWYWSILAATAFAQARNEVVVISLAEMEITAPMLLHLYPDIDPVYALTTDLSQPLLFAPIGDKVRLIDGSHRVLKALFNRVDELPAYFLTPEESDASLIARLPAIPGMTGTPMKDKPFGSARIPPSARRR